MKNLHEIREISCLIKLLFLAKITKQKVFFLATGGCKIFFYYVVAVKGLSHYCGCSQISDVNLWKVDITL